MKKRATTALLVGLPLASCVVLGALACAPIRVATGYTSHLVCSGTFVSGLDPERVYEGHVRHETRLVAWGIHYEVDRLKREVTSSFLGGAESRAVYREGLGCTVLRGEGPVEAAPPPPRRAEPDLAPIDGDAVVEPETDALRVALAHAFDETDPYPRRTHAVVVVHRGRVIGERYAPGFAVDTPLLGWSLSKSITNALVGILVRQGKLAPDGLAPVPAWSDPANPRHAITVNELVRQTTGLRFTETGSGFDENSRLLFLEPDAARAAENVPLDRAPGTAWEYASGNAIILSHIIRSVAGGTAADYLQFARRELFEPLGMRATIELDGAGTAYGGSFVHATPRDWARFGVLYARDGVVGGRRILPEGWVAYSSTRTFDTPYAAGFWVGSPEWRARWELPDDFFVGTGVQGQRLVIVPSEDLVIVRMGASEGPLTTLDADGLGLLVSEVRSAIKARVTGAVRPNGSAD